MSIPVHEERLDHSGQHMSLRLLKPSEPADGQAMYLAAHRDFLLGQASNGALLRDARARFGSLAGMYHTVRPRALGTFAASCFWLACLELSCTMKHSASRTSTWSTLVLSD